MRVSREPERTSPEERGTHCGPAREDSRNLGETERCGWRPRALGEISVGNGDEYCRIAALQGKKVETESQDDSQCDENM